MLRAFICVTCGTQYPPSQQPPARCDICEDERQFVNPRGQTWTSLEEIRKFHRAVISRYEVGLYGICATPEPGNKGCQKRCLTISATLFASARALPRLVARSGRSARMALIEIMRFWPYLPLWN